MISKYLDVLMVNYIFFILFTYLCTVPPGLGQFLSSHHMFIYLQLPVLIILD